MHPLSFLTITFLIGVVVLFPFYLLESIFFHPVHLSAAFVISELYLAIFPSILAYLAFNEAVKIIGPNIAGLFSHLMPVFGSILAVIFLDERFQTFHVFGMLLILTGIVLVIRQKKQTPTTRPMEYNRTSKNKV
jgi:drug/metabolite transporter (DMT)-like permease